MADDSRSIEFTRMPPALLGSTKYYDRFRTQADEAVNILKEREMAAAALKQTTAETALLADFLRASKTDEGFDPFSDTAIPKALALTQTRFAPILDAFAGMEKVKNQKMESIAQLINANANLLSAQGSYAKATDGSDMTYNDALALISDYEAGESKLPAPNLEESIGAFRKRTGMNIPESHNNPGNITYGDFAKKYGALPGQKDAKGNVVALFKDVETGRKAMADLLGNENYRDLPLDAAMKRYSGGSYGADVLDVLSSQDLTRFSIDPAALAERKMSDLAPEEREAVAYAMMKREGFGARKGELGFSDFEAPVDISQYDMPEKVRKAYRLKSLHENKEGSDVVKKARAELHGVYSTLGRLPEAKRIYEQVAQSGVGDDDIIGGTKDAVLTGIMEQFYPSAPKATLLQQVRQYADAMKKRASYEGILEEWGGSYRDLITRYGIDREATQTAPAKTKSPATSTGNFTTDKDGNVIYNGPKPK